MSTYTTREGLTRAASLYDPRDDYTDAELAHMDPDGDWPSCVTCGWSPERTDKPRSLFVAELTASTPHNVQVDPDDLTEENER